MNTDFKILLVNVLGPKDYNFISPSLKHNVKTLNLINDLGYYNGQVHRFSFTNEYISTVVIEAECLDNYEYCREEEHLFFNILLEKMILVLNAMGYPVEREDYSWASPDCQVFYDKETDTFGWDS